MFSFIARIVRPTWATEASIFSI